jgi:hypothetical protein
MDDELAQIRLPGKSQAFYWFLNAYILTRLNHQAVR